MSVEAGMEKAQGGVAEGAALEATAPLVRARGGTNGWGGNRTSCWSWWQRVLLVLPVCLVVPAEAAGAAQAVGGVATTVAAAVVGAIEVLNYWAGMEDDTAGDLTALCKGVGVIRIMSTDLRRVERDQTGQDMTLSISKPSFIMN